MNLSISLIENIKQLLEIKTDKEFYTRFEIAQSSFSSWKTRDAIDLRYLLEKIPIPIFIKAYMSAKGIYATDEESELLNKYIVAEKEAEYEKANKTKLLEEENKLLRETVEILEKDLLNLQKEQNDLMKEYIQILKQIKKD